VLLKTAGICIHSHNLVQKAWTVSVLTDDGKTALFALLTASGSVFRNKMF
jgi:hypothetical protein